MRSVGFPAASIAIGRNMKTLRSRVLAKDLLLGTFCAIADPTVIEITAKVGFDFIIIDAEHTQIDRGKFEPLLRAAEVGQTPALIRVPGNDRIWINAALDSGAAGVLVPRVNSADDVRAAVAATRYPPLGERGVGPGRASAYGMQIEQAVARANENIVLAVQVETAQGLANIEEIAAVDGVDAVYIGPGDLAISIGAFGPEGRPALQRTFAKIAQCCLGRDRTVGLFNMTPDDLNHSIGLGMTFLTLGADSVFLVKGLIEAAEVIRKARANALLRT
jgi:4-hydroxy-2-oxoheptanedioate aldolase